MRVLLLALLILTAGCSSVRWPDSVNASIDDMIGVGNPEVDECQITFGGELPAVPCEVRIEVQWQL